MPKPQATATNADVAPSDVIAAAVLHHVTIDQIAVAAGRAGQLSIDRVALGDATVEKVVIEDLGAELECGAALLRDVRMILELHFKVRWAYDLGWFGADSGIKTLGSKAKGIELHDIGLPSLQDIAINVPEATIEDIEAELDPIADLDLGGGGFDGLSIDQTRLPTDGFGLAGMGVGSVEVGSFGAPASDSQQLRLDRFTPDGPIRLPNLKVRNIEVPEIEVPDAGSEGPVSVNDIELEEFEAPMFKIGKVFKANFLAIPILHLQIGELVLSELTAKASIGCARVDGVQAPVSVEGLRLGDLSLQDLAVNQIAL